MQRVVVITLWMIFAMVFQSAIMPAFPSGRVWSDLLFFLIIILGLRFSFTTGFILALAAGYVADVVSFAPAGTAMVSYVLLLIFIRKVRANIFIESRRSLFFWIMVASFFRQVVQMIFLAMHKGALGYGALDVGTLLLQSLWDGAIGVILVPFLEKMLFTDWGPVFRKKRLRN